MAQPEENDIHAIGGAHPGTSSPDEIAASVSIEIDTSRDLKDVASDVMSSAEWFVQSFSDPNRAVKYAIDPTVSYYGNGALSLVPRLGKLLFAANLNEANRGAFSLDQGGSSFYSSLGATTLGSLEIDTVDGQVLNPLSPQQPSTNYSPTKPWIKKIFPSLSTKNLMTLAILELINVALIKALDSNISGNTSKNSESKTIDIATIIVDNQKIQDELLGDA